MQTLRRPPEELTPEEALAAISELREAASELAEGMIELLDVLDGDPDLEVEEGNDEPSLAFSSEPVLLANGTVYDGEIYLSEEGG